MIPRPWLRTTLIATVIVASFAAALAIAYEMAVARVPRQRAAFESLVRAQTGLDIRFNELAFRWGWYGPEAVFRRVELGEPGRSNVLLRAPELVVGINAWQTARAGQLVAGRITLIAPDVDLERLGRKPPSASAKESIDPGRESRARILERWKGGVIDLQGGTLKVPDPAGGTSALTLHIRRAALKRDGSEWSGHALVFLPERLGRTARVVFQLKGDLNSPALMSGGVRFEGVRLSFSSWRGVLGAMPQLAANLPEWGTGDVSFDLTLKRGVVEKANGDVHAADLVVGTPAWLEPVQPSRSSLRLDYVTGSWRFQRRGATSQVQIDQLVLGREQKDPPLPPFTVEMNPGHLHGTLPDAPLGPLTTLARWIAPELTASGVTLDGKVDALDVDWNDARPEGFRLAASAHVADATATSTSRGFTLKSVPLRLHASERALWVEVDAPAANLQLANDPEHPVETLKLVSRAVVTREGGGWRVTIPRFELKDAVAEGELSGTLIADSPDGAPLVDLRGTVAHADIARLQARFAEGVSRMFGPAGLRVGKGRIENGAFEMRGRIDALDAARFVGSFNVSHAGIPSDGTWPEVDGVDASVEWNGPHVSVSVSDGRAGDFDLESVEAQWDAAGTQPARLTGRAHGRLENALALLRSNPDLQKQAPHLQELAASGDALFDFDVTIPPAAAATSSSHIDARISTMLEGAQFTLAPGLPPVESLHGAVSYESGRLQRSTLSATWLGGPLTLNIGERRDRRGSALTVQAQGFVDARKLVALSRISPLTGVSGQTAWSGEFAYVPPTETTAARWTGHADSALIGVTSSLPAPLAKVATATLPLHIDIAGHGDSSELHASLADRLRAALALNVVDRAEWRVDRGAIRLGGGSVSLPDDEVIEVRGHVRRIDAPAYMLAWQKLRKMSPDSHADVDISSDELSFSDRVYSNGSVQIDAIADSPGSSVVQIEAPSFGVLTATLNRPDSREVVLSDLRLRTQSLSGTGTLRCSDDVASCHGQFTLDSTDVAASLADLGFRPDVSAARGALSGEISWRPSPDAAWLETVTGTLSMRFDDGIARRLDSGSGEPLPILTVPALLSGISRHADVTAAPAAAALAADPGELKFNRLEAHFQLRDGQATTSDLHFDGDAEILMRGRTGLLAGDYDQEAWVLRGEERLPSSMRRLASAPRVAAAWLTLRELIGGDDASRSRIVLRLRGSWSEPLVSVE